MFAYCLVMLLYDLQIIKQKNGKKATFGIYLTARKLLFLPQ